MLRSLAPAAALVAGATLSSSVGNHGRTLYALCGLPFAGKSTIARELAKKVGAPIVRLDAINGERGLGLDGQPIPLHEWERTYVEAYRRLEQALVANNSVIFDHVNFTRAERDRVRHIAARHGANVQIIYVSVTVAEARRRLIANRAAKAGVTCATTISSWW